MNAEAREHLLAHLAVDEGCVLHAYKDSLGFWTIGFGRLIDKRRGGGITHAEAMLLLDNDVTRHWDDLVEIFPWVLDLDDVRQVALANLAFNLGVSGLAKFTNTLAAVKRRDWIAVEQGLRHSLWYKQVGQSRSERIIGMMTSGKWPEQT